MYIDADMWGLVTYERRSPMRTELDEAYSEPSWSQAGFIDLQCPHQGARNLTNAPFPVSVTSSLKLDLVSSTALAWAEPTSASRMAWDSI